MELVLWSIGLLLVVVWLGVVLVGPPYVPTLKSDLRALFRELKLGPKDRFVDLGAGDGRVLVMAAQEGARVAGVEINPFLAALAFLRLRRFRGSVTLGDMWQYHLPKGTTHVFVFAAGRFMDKLERYLDEQVKQQGHLTVICYGFHFQSTRPRRVFGAFNLYEF